MIDAALLRHRAHPAHRVAEGVGVEDEPPIPRLVALLQPLAAEVVDHVQEQPAAVGVAGGDHGAVRPAGRVPHDRFGRGEKFGKGVRVQRLALRIVQDVAALRVLPDDARLAQQRQVEDHARRVLLGGDAVHAAAVGDLFQKEGVRLVQPAERL